MSKTLKPETVARWYLGYDYNYPVQILINSKEPPVMTGISGGHFTKGGTRISHPGAYAKSGWSNMEYRTSSLTIEVGDKWLNQYCFEEHISDAGKVWVDYTTKQIIHGFTCFKGFHSRRKITLVKLGEFEYHSRGWVPKKASKEAIEGLRRQKSQRIIEGYSLERVFVGPDDSIRAGNCQSMTQSFVNKIQSEQGLIGGIRADCLLSIRKDNYTKRAVNAAIQRLLGV